MSHQPIVGVNVVGSLGLAKIEFFAESTPSDKCIVLDVSSSMRHNLACAKEGVIEVINSLISGDRLTLIKYSAHAKVVFSNAPHDKKESMIDQVNMIQLGKWTNMMAGWTLGYDELRKMKLKNKQMFLFTDGVISRGERRADVIAQMTRGAFLKDKVITNAYGLGGYCQFQLLSKIAQPSGGFYKYIRDAVDIPNIFKTSSMVSSTVRYENIRIKVFPKDWNHEISTSNPQGDIPSINGGDEIKYPFKIIGNDISSKCPQESNDCPVKVVLNYDYKGKRYDYGVETFDEKIIPQMIANWHIYHDQKNKLITINEMLMDDRTNALLLLDNGIEILKDIEDTIIKAYYDKLVRCRKAADENDLNDWEAESMDLILASNPLKLDSKFESSLGTSS